MLLCTNKFLQLLLRASVSSAIGRSSNWNHHHKQTRMLHLKKDKQRGWNALLICCHRWGTWLVVVVTGKNSAGAKLAGAEEGVWMEEEEEEEEGGLRLDDGLHKSALSYLFQSWLNKTYWRISQIYAPAGPSVTCLKVTLPFLNNKKQQYSWV